MNLNETITGSLKLEQRTLLLVLSTFGFFGTVFGTWLVFLADLQATFLLSPAMLGAALAASF